MVSYAIGVGRAFEEITPAEADHTYDCIVAKVRQKPNDELHDPLFGLYVEEPGTIRQLVNNTLSITHVIINK